jgi:hypothetical protein
MDAQTALALVLDPFVFNDNTGITYISSYFSDKYSIVYLSNLEIMLVELTIKNYSLYVSIKTVYTLLGKEKLPIVL